MNPAVLAQSLLPAVGCLDVRLESSRDTVSTLVELAWREPSGLTLCSWAEDVSQSVAAAQAISYALAPHPSVDPGLEPQDWHRVVDVINRLLVAVPVSREDLIALCASENPRVRSLGLHLSSL